MDKSIDENWSNWAIEMLQAGFETEHLAQIIILEKPLNQFELKWLADKILNELSLKFNDCKKALLDYASYLMHQAFENKITFIKALSLIKELYLFLDYEYELSEFYELYHAKIDLEENGIQFYHQEATKENIDFIIFEEFSSWLEKYPINYC